MIIHLKLDLNPFRKISFDTLKLYEYKDSIQYL